MTATRGGRDEVSTVRVGDVTLAYETFGDEGARPLLLVMGFAAQMVHWPTGFCESLAEAGHFVVRFDNRDVGLSSRMDDLGDVDIMEAMGALAFGSAVRRAVHPGPHGG